MNPTPKKGTLVRLPDGDTHRYVVILCRPSKRYIIPAWIVSDGEREFTSFLMQIRYMGGRVVEGRSAKVLGYLVRMRQKGGQALYGLRGESEGMGGKMFWTPARGDRMMERREIARELNSFREGAG